MATTAAEVLAAARERLRRAGVPQPAQEARWLAEAAWGLPVATPLSELPVDGAARLEALLLRRIGGEPLAHVTGLAGFRHLELGSDARALIPRPETEGLVELVLARVPEGAVVDIGTGSGCIALALAQEGRYREVVGVDADPGALALARENAARTGLRVEWLEGDLTAPLAGRRFNAAVSNPPYLSEAEYRALDPSVRAWEPRQALESGPEGMDHVRRLLRDLPRVLVPGALLALEVDSARAGRVAEEAGALGWQHPRVHEDIFGRARFVTAHRGAAT